MPSKRSGRVKPVKEDASSSTTSDVAAATSSVPGGADDVAEATKNMSLLSKVVQPGTSLTPEEALAASHWLRQLAAIVMGIVFGALQLKGFAPVMTFVVVALTTPYSILNALHELDLDEIATKGAIQTEGFFPAIALFFLSWIISYTIFLPAS